MGVQNYIDDPDYLRRFFVKKGQPFIVFSVAAVMGMDPERHREFVNVLIATASPDEAAGPIPSDDVDLKEWIQRFGGFRGYARVDADALCRKLSMRALVQFQDFCHVYKEGRESRFEPVSMEPCDCRKIQGKVDSAQCMSCLRAYRDEPCGPEHRDLAKLMKFQKADPRCRACKGVGTVPVLIEMSKIEQRLAAGMSWSEIDAQEAT